MEKRKYDLIVAGGGFAGIGAALSAAREGLDVLLFDKNNCLGGAAVGCLVNPFMPNATKDPETDETFFLSEGIFAEIIQRLDNENAIRGRTSFNEEYLKIILNRLLLDAGVTLLFNSYLCDVETIGDKLNAVTVINKTGKVQYYADFFVDATGDADLAALSNCPFQLGREKDNLCQPMTLCFRLSNVDIELFRAERPQMQELYKQYQKEGKIKNIRENILAFTNMLNSNVLHLNSTRIVKRNPVDACDITLAEIEAREQCFELFDFLRNNFKSCENSEMLITAHEIGVRESRKIIGEYVLSQEDLINCVKFDDSIAAGNYDIDIHNPEGTGTSHHYFKPGEYYTIPYRSLIPKNITNMLVAGRCISTTHEAQASIRIMPICCCLGEAAGKAIAIAKADNTTVKEISIEKLQSMLKKSNAVF